MKHQVIGPDRSLLLITISEEEQQELMRLSREEEITSDLRMIGFLEPLTCNSELEWIDPAETGDLTSAPMLGIRDSVTDDLRSYGGQPPVLERWAWMGYETCSLLEVLRNNRCAVLQDGPLVPEGEPISHNP